MPYQTPLHIVEDVRRIEEEEALLARIYRLEHKLAVLLLNRDSDLVKKYFMMEAELIVTKSIEASLRERLGKYEPKCLECGARMMNLECYYCEREMRRGTGNA